MNATTKILSILICTAFFTACSNSRHLHAGESLFKGSKVNIDDNVVSKKDKKVLKSNLIAVVRPKPNSKTLGVRLKLTLYNAAGNPKKNKGLRRWIREKLGEPPVLTSSVRLPADKDLMVNLLQNMGYFNAGVSARIDTNKRKKSTAVFDVVTGPQYTIKKAYFSKDSSLISHYIDSTFANTLLKDDAPYNLDLIKAERNRIDQVLKNKGYFYFKPDYLIVVVDSSIGDHKVNMYVRLKKKDIPEEAKNAYSIGDIFIYDNYKLRGKKNDTDKSAKIAIDNYYVIDNKNAFKPALFSRLIIVEKGDIYNVDDQNITLSRLVNVGNFKFVKSRFEPASDSLLDLYYYLTPFPRKAVSFQAGVQSQNDDRDGIDGSISFRNRNAFKGAEQFLVKISGGFDAQYSGPVREPNIYNLGAEASLSFPRFEVPFINIQTDSRFLPHSIIKLKYNFESESDLLRINSYTATYGYDWKQSARIEHQFYPFNFTYVKTDTLGNARDLSELYGNLVFNGFIIGPTYEFTYNSQVGSTKTSSFYFDGLIDLAGNVMGQLENANYQKNPKTLLGSTYAEYIKLQPDFRYYLRLSPAATIASRLMAGVGIPYGNSSELPNIKEFWAGGNSDLRGFPSRLVGPGTFNAYDHPESSYIETLGDLKLESNIELRQRIYKFIGLGLFADAGNIWLYNNNPALPGGAFTSDFYKQIAVDAGFGLRFDFKILILRLDLGIPLREPWVSENNSWVINKIDFGSPNWRKNNMVINIAIGYPF